MHYKVGTRGSKLALTQTGMVIEKLREAYPEDTFEAEVIRTTGDANQVSPISEVGSKGIFVDEIERALLEDRIQLAVHSMKDMPAKPSDGLIFSRAWQREDPRDVLILREAESLMDIPQGGRIGTGSKRRGYQLWKLRPDLEIVPIRGNIDTRLRKLHELQPDGKPLDGIVLAAAGIHRLGLHPERMRYLTVDEMIPAPTQGILAIQLNAENTELLEKVNRLADPDTDAAATVERTFLDRIGGDCHLPIAACCQKTEQGYRLLAMFGSEDGSNLATVSLVNSTAGTELAEKAAAEILNQLEDGKNG